MQTPDEFMSQAVQKAINTGIPILRAEDSNPPAKLAQEALALMGVKPTALRNTRDAASTRSQAL